jgi:tRNA dimethylallyltransferase
MTGGSGMYIDAVCEGIDDIPDVDPEVRERYNHIYETEGLESLRTSLKILDPEYYTRVDLKNHKRIIRALEICESTGKPFSSFLKGEKSKRDFRIIKIGLTLSREELYERIDRRAGLMVERGLELEASGLYEMRGLNALNSVGYKEFFDFFEGKITREQAITLIKRNSRRYAKRQLTWWKRDNSVNWYDPADKEGITGFIDMASRSDSQQT